MSAPDIHRHVALGTQCNQRTVSFVGWGLAVLMHHSWPYDRPQQVNICMCCRHDAEQAAQQEQQLLQASLAAQLQAEQEAHTVSSGAQQNNIQRLTLCWGHGHHEHCMLLSPPGTLAMVAICCVQYACSMGCDGVVGCRKQQLSCR